MSYSFVSTGFTPRRVHVSSAERARATRVKHEARAVALGLAELAHQGKADPADEVVALFLAVAPGLRAEVFERLDADWRMAGHAMLRRVRNDPDAGPRLFALWG